MKRLRYKKMIEDILPLVEDDFCLSMECKLPIISNGKKIKRPEYTQKEAQEMAGRLGRVFMIAHRIYCTPCQWKYLSEKSKIKDK